MRIKSMNAGADPNVSLSQRLVQTFPKLNDSNQTATRGVDTRSTMSCVITQRPSLGQRIKN